MTDRVTRVAIPVVLGLLAVLAGVLTSEPAWLTVPVAVVAVIASGLLALEVDMARAAGALVVLAGVSVLCAPSASNLGWFATCVLVGGAGVLAGLRPALVLLALTFLALTVSAVAVSDDPGWSPWYAAGVFSLLVGVLVHRERGLVVELRAAQAGLADRARTDERERIAREMHDVMGHALTVSLLHISSARLSLAEDPAEAAASLAEAERLAQQSLAEVRSAVSTMKGTRSPLPGTTEIEGLLESFRRAGTTVTAEVDRDLAALTSAQGLTVYRILQESLSNVARHAPGSPAHVQVTVADDATCVVVASDGAPDPTAEAGNGLDGMRERAEALGGLLTAGPWQGGWRVEAVLPR